MTKEKGKCVKGQGKIYQKAGKNISEQSKYTKRQIEDILMANAQYAKDQHIKLNYVKGLSKIYNSQNKVYSTRKGNMPKTK